MMVKVIFSFLISSQLFANSVENQKTVLQNMMTAGCAIYDSIEATEDCFQAGQEWLDKATNPDPLEFEKNQAGFMLKTCTIGNDENADLDWRATCYKDEAFASGSEKLKALVLAQFPDYDTTHPVYWYKQKFRGRISNLENALLKFQEHR